MSTATGIGMIQRRLDMKESTTIGKLAGAGILSTGRIFYVKHTSDTDRPDFIGDVAGTRRFVTIQEGIAACRSGSNDYVLLCPQDDSGAWAQTVDIDILGRDIHLVGVSATGNRPLITFSTAKSIDIGNGALTGARTRGIELGNLKVTSSGTSTIHCVDVGDSSGFTFDTWIHDCLIVQSGTTAAIAEIKDFGSDLLVERCTIGAYATHPDDNYLQGAGVIGGEFRDCLFLHDAAGAGDQFATVVSTSLPCLFKNCVFVNKGTATMTVGIASAGLAVLHNCGMTKATAMATTSQSLITPGGMGITVADADVFNPGLAIDGAEPVAADT